MTDEERFRFEARLKMVRALGHARAQEQKRLGDKIEMLLWDAKTPEACEVLISVAISVFGDKAHD